MITHAIYRVVGFTIVGDYTLRVVFDDQTVQTIDFAPILRGALYGPLQDRALFQQVQLDSEIHTLVWPNGADFDPATLHDWPQQQMHWLRLAQRWEATPPASATVPIPTDAVNRHGR